MQQWYISCCRVKTAVQFAMFLFPIENMLTAIVSSWILSYTLDCNVRQYTRLCESDWTGLDSNLLCWCVRTQTPWHVSSYVTFSREQYLTSFNHDTSHSAFFSAAYYFLPLAPTHTFLSKYRHFYKTESKTHSILFPLICKTFRNRPLIKTPVPKREKMHLSSWVQSVV
jgi:hypothetical protein